MSVRCNGGVLDGKTVMVRLGFCGFNVCLNPSYHKRTYHEYTVDMENKTATFIREWEG